MEKTIFEKMGGTFVKVGDYYLPDLVLPAEEEKPIGVWGQRHLRYLKEYRKVVYFNLLTSGKLNSYLADIYAKPELTYQNQFAFPGYVTTLIWIIMIQITPKLL